MPTASRPRALIVLAVVALGTVDAWTLIQPWQVQRGWSKQGVATVPATDGARTRSGLMDFVKVKLSGLKKPQQLEPMTYEQLEAQHLRVLSDIEGLQREREVMLKEREGQVEQLKTWSGSVKQLKSQVAGLEQELRVTRKKIEDGQAAKRQLERSLADAQKALDRKQPGDSSLLRINSQILKELEEERKIVASLRARETVLLKERDQVQARMDKVLAEMSAKFEDEKRAMAMQLEQMQAKQAAVLKMERDLIGREQALTRDNQGLQTLLEKQRQRYTVKAEKLEADLNVLKMKELEYDSIQQRYNELDAVAKRTNGQLGLVTSRINLMEEDKQRLMASTELSRQQAETALQQLNNFRAEVDKTRKMAEEMKKNWMAAESEAKSADSKLREEQEAHRARVMELRYEMSQAVRDSRAVVDQYTSMIKEVSTKESAIDEKVGLCMSAVTFMQNALDDATKEYQAGETVKLQHLSKKHAEEVKRIMKEHDDKVRLLCDSHDERVKTVTDSLEVNHRKALDDLRAALVSQFETKETQFKVQLNEVTAQAERVQAQYVVDRKKWEEEMGAVQQTAAFLTSKLESANNLRIQLEEEKARLIQVMQSDKRQWEEERAALKREIEETAAQFKRYDGYMKDPLQIIMYGIRRLLAMEEDAAMTF